MKIAARLALAGSSLWLLWTLATGGWAWTAAFAVALSSSTLILKDGWTGAQKRPLSMAFWGSLTLYLSTFHWRGGDDILQTVLPIAVLKYGTMALNPVIDPYLKGPEGMQFLLAYGPYQLSVHPLAPGLMAIPLYVIPILCKAPLTIQFLHNLAKISGAVITAGSAAAFLAAARRRASPRFAWLLTALFALGTWTFSVSSQALWLHGPVMLGLSLGLLGFSGESRKDDLICGFGLGMALAARLDTIFLAAALGAYLLFKNPRRLLPIAIGALPWALEMGLYWLHYTGRLAPPDSGYQGRMFNGFIPQAFFAMLASPTRGLLWFCPAAFFGVWAAYKRPASVAPWLAAAGLVHFLFLSCYKSWLAGMTFGERYISAIALAWVFLSVEIEDELSRGRAARLWSQAAAFSIVVHSLGAYLRWPYFSWGGPAANIWNFRLHPIAQLAFPEGPLDAWPAPARWLSLAAVLWLWQWLAGRILGYLRQP